MNIGDSIIYSIMQDNPTDLEDQILEELDAFDLDDKEEKNDNDDNDDDK